MNKKNVMYGLLALLGLYFVTKKRDSDDSTSGGSSDVGNGTNDVDVMNPTPENRVPVKTPVVEVTNAGTKGRITPLDIRVNSGGTVDSGGTVNRSNGPSTGIVVPEIRF